MGEIVVTHKPIRIQLDASEELRDALNAQFILNARTNVNINSEFSLQGNPTKQGGNAGDLTPIQSPELLCSDAALPTGNNVCIGAYNSVKTSELYYEIWNEDPTKHTLWVYDSTNGCRKIYQGACLGYHFEPEHHIPAHRSALYIVNDSDGAGNQTIRNKFYVYTDGINWQFLIDVESAIATDSYNPVAYPYFETFYPHCDPCEFIQLGIRPPQDCPKVLPFDDDTQLQYYEPEPENNNLKQKVWYFATSFIDRWGRHSVMSPYSTAVFLDGGDCNADAEDIKCFRLQLDAGSWLVEKIIVYFSNDGINWFKYDEIEKYIECPPETNFWEREIALNNYYKPSEPCSPTGCFQTIIYNWDFRSRSPHDFEHPFSIVIDGVTYTHEGLLPEGSPPPESPPPDDDSPPSDESPPDESPPSDSPPDDGSPPVDEDLKEVVIWLNSLGLGTFEVVDEILRVSSSSIVYGDFTLGTSPPIVLSPYFGEGSPPLSPPHSRGDDDTDECSTANTFIYQFCANKQCIPIAPSEVARLFDDLPIASIAQAVVDDKVAYGNNLRGYDNFICPIENIDINVAKGIAPCETELVDITIDCVIHNFYAHINNFIYTPANTTDVAFGGLGHPLIFPLVVEYADETVSLYDQKIMNPYRGVTTNGNQGSPGFLGGMRGTNFKAVSQQYEINNLTQTWFFTNVDHNHTTKTIMQGIMDGNYKIQRFKFRIPKGYYIFDLYSHLATGFDDCVGTSTYFLGTTLKTLYNPNGVIGVDENQREIFINACDGDVVYEKYIVIADLVEPAPTAIVASNAKSVCGYLKEKDTNVPVELAHLNINSPYDVKSSGTDANGFYFATGTADYIIYLDVLNPNTCNLTAAHDGGNSIDNKELLTLNLYVDNPTGGMPAEDFNNCGHELVSGNISDCNGNPIKGVNVLLTRTGQVGVTDASGNYTILAHDDANWYAQFPGFGRRLHNIDSVLISQNGICIYSECDDCDTCIDVQHVWFSPANVGCFHCPVLTETYNFALDIISGAEPSLKTGGLYAVSIIGYDYLDRNNFAQRIGFFTVPTIQSNGLLLPYHFTWSVGALNLPSWVAKIRFAVRPNSYEFLLSWDANKVEFLDVQGNITSPSIATNIKLYIDGLNTFITNNLLNTNVGYQWVAGDRIRIIANGDGTVYDTLTNDGLIDLPVSSLVNGNALLIPNDPRLVNLTANATFELYRVPVCTTEPVYLEQCPSIPVIDGEPIITSGTIPFFDTYQFFRAIPQTGQDGLPTVFISPHRYEHFAPSDFWGTAVIDSSVVKLFATGRPFVRNENARQTWRIDEIAWSDSLLEDDVINGLGTWRSENQKNYGIQNFGGIIAMCAQRHLLFALCENDYFVVNIALNLLQITTQGNVIANPDYFGAAQQKVGNTYGCDKRDTNTILFQNEWITWIDVFNNAVCLCDYQGVKDISVDDRSYWFDKLQYIASLRNANQFTDNFMFLTSGYDPYADEIVITSFARTGSPPIISYGTDEKEDAIELNETKSFKVGEQAWTGNYSFTPEFLSIFNSNDLDSNQFITWVQGRPYIHHRRNPTSLTYNNFYGSQYTSIIEFVFNGGQGKNIIQKRFLAMRIMCKQSLWYSDKIFTQSYQESNIPIEEFQQVEQYSEAGFLCDKNTIHPNGISAIFDGDSLSGDWIKIRLIIDPNNAGKYFELEGIVISATESY